MSQELPYATLMYLCPNTLPVGTAVPNPPTKRIRMVVAASGANEVGQGVTLKRDLFRDFVRASGEQPGKLLAAGVLTDTDNPGEAVEAW